MSREEIMDDLQEPQQENYELEEFINEIRKYYKTHEFKRSAINDCVSRQAAIDAAECIVEHHAITPYKTMAEAMDHLKRILNGMPSAQPEQSTEVRDILQYLDEYLHPIVSPEHWSVYSELYDMVSMLSSTQPPRIKGRWIDDGLYSDNFPHHEWRCSECGENVIEIDTPWFKFCPNCGADMRGEENARI